MNDDRNGTGRLARLRRWAGAVKQDVVALYIAARDPRVPWHVKLAATAIAAYALSPIDPIPDFIPVLGYLDELILLPIAIFFVIKMIPDPLMAGVPRGGAETIRASGQPSGSGGDHRSLDCRGSISPVGILANPSSINVFPNCAACELLS